MRVHSWSPDWGVAVDPDRGQEDRDRSAATPPNAVQTSSARNPAVRRLDSARLALALVVAALLVPAEAGAQREDVIVASGISAADRDGDRPRRPGLRGPAGRRPARDQERRLLPTPFLSVQVTSTTSAAYSASPSTRTSRRTATSTSTTRPRPRPSSTGQPLHGKRRTLTSRSPAARTFILNPIPPRRAGTTAARSTSGPTASSTSRSARATTRTTRSRWTTLSGKILRINSDGTIPTDNPFYGSTTGNNRAIWALGLRNPFTFDIQHATGRIFINDVGENA